MKIIFSFLVPHACCLSARLIQPNVLYLSSINIEYIQKFSWVHGLFLSSLVESAVSLTYLPYFALFAIN